MFRSEKKKKGEASPWKLPYINEISASCTDISLWASKTINVSFLCAYFSEKAPLTRFHRKTTSKYFAKHSSRVNDVLIKAELMPRCPSKHRHCFKTQLHKVGITSVPTQRESSVITGYHWICSYRPVLFYHYKPYCSRKLRGWWEKKKNSTRALKHRSSIASGEKKLTLPLTMTSHWVALALGPFTGGKLRPRRHGRLQSLNETIWTAVPSQLLAHGKTALNNVVVNAWRNTTP